VIGRGTVLTPNRVVMTFFFFEHRTDDVGTQLKMREPGMLVLRLKLQVRTVNEMQAWHLDI
jgi:hypothetical protein